MSAELTDEQRKNLVIVKCLDGAMEQLAKVETSTNSHAKDAHLWNARQFIKTAHKMLTDG